MKFDFPIIIIDEDFTYNMYNFLTTDMTSPTIRYYVNSKTNAIAVKITDTAAEADLHLPRSLRVEGQVPEVAGGQGDEQARIDGEQEGRPPAVAHEAGVRRVGDGVQVQATSRRQEVTAEIAAARDA